MSNFTTENFRQILDSGDILANSLSSVLVEKLGSELSRDDLVKVVNVVQQEVKNRHDGLVGEIQHKQQIAAKKLYKTELRQEKKRHKMQKLDE